MKYYLDTEFAEKPGRIDLISIGIKCEDGRTFYAENKDFDLTLANPWVLENVIPQLLWYGKGAQEFYCPCSPAVSVYGSLEHIKATLLDFIKESPEFWGYYADYDWVVFCWLFGTMMDLPTGWPMYCRDLKQLLDESGLTSIPDPEGEHNALVDACWNEQLHKHLVHTSSLIREG